MTRQQEIIEGLTRLANRKSPWQQSREQKAPGAFHRWWTELLKEQPGLGEALGLNRIDREYVREQVRRNKPSGHRGKLGCRWVPRNQTLAQPAPGE